MQFRRVDLATDYLFSTWCRSDLRQTPAQAAQEKSGIKGVNYGWAAVGADEATYRNPNYPIDLSGEDRSLPPATVVIAPYKPDCKALRDILLTRADYKALFYTLSALPHDAPSCPGGPTTCTFRDTEYRAEDAYAFECAPARLPV